MKGFTFLGIIAVAVIAAILAVANGCSTIQKYVDDPTAAVSGLNGSNIVAVATNWMSNKAVNDIVQSILSDPKLMADLTAAWDRIRAQYDEIVEPGTGTVIVPGNQTSTALPEIKIGRTITGCGRVNNWWQHPEWIDEETSYMQSRNVRVYPIELTGPSSEKVLSSAAKMEQVKAAYKILLANCRAKGIWILVGAVNDNMGQGKWGDPKIPLSAVLPAAKAMCDFVREQGPENVLFKPVSETQTSAGKSLENYCASTMAGFYLVNNGSAGRPSSTVSWSRSREYHPTSTGNWPSKNDAFIVSDTGSILAQLNKGGNVMGDGDPAKIKPWIQAGVANGYPIVAYYGHTRATMDKPVIDACANGVSSTTDSSTVAVPVGWPEELQSVTWLHTDVSAWPVTTSIDAKVGNLISFSYDKANVWPAVDGVNANPWVFAKVEGKWYAATFEWLRKGQTSKPAWVLDKSTGKGDHIKVSPLSNWTPKSGERIGLMVSGLARSGTRNVQERSNPVMVVWP